MTDLATASADDLRAWLFAGSKFAGDNRHAAAVGLLDFTGLLDRASVRAHIEVEDLDDGRTRETVAWLDWAGLAGADIGQLNSARYRLLRLAVSIARAGIGVELHEALQDLGTLQSV
jgi:hypothetical protein